MVLVCVSTFNRINPNLINHGTWNLNIIVVYVIISEEFDIGHCLIKVNTTAFLKCSSCVYVCVHTCVCVRVCVCDNTQCKINIIFSCLGKSETYRIFDIGLISLFWNKLGCKGSTSVLLHFSGFGKCKSINFWCTGSSIWSMLIVYYLILPDVFHMEYVDCLLSDITCCVLYRVC